ncbi:GntP family permease [Brevibacterium yomogidense]|uniref:D-beta-hydroxybutyrate permease n=1 Tax=Brevibacterium yomogidense TaxID=946573 RepID=A0A1X6WYJ8_9MICO|nr:GntP family permease [Brevibacterium yomogidense]SLM91057.1 D-beta-hydroxybutyrate permease [Brevibacterium yomogidense]
MSWGLIGIFVSLALLIGLAYRGHSVIAVAPIAAAVAMLFAGVPLLAGYTQIFMPALGGFIISYFPMFLTGAIFGKLMTVSGFAESIASWIARVVGARHAIFITALLSALFTYGGINAWVVVFTVFPIARSLFQQADIPKRLVPAAIAAGFLTFALGTLPGSPQIHNTLPTSYFGTTTFSAPFLGLITGLVMFGLSILYLRWREKKIRAAGESFNDLTVMERRGAAPHAEGGAGDDGFADDSAVPAAPGTAGAATAVDAKRTTLLEFLAGLFPLIAVIGANALFTFVIIPSWNTDYLAEDLFGNVTVADVIGVWSVTAAMLVAILSVFVLRPRRARAMVDELSEGAKNSVLPVFNTATEVGYGAVITSLAAFTVIRDGLFGMGGNAVLTSSATTAVISGVTGSASGGLAITLEAFGDQFAQMAAAQGIDPAIIHRAVATASTSFDSLPHNGAVITLLLVTGLTHRESYKDIGVITIGTPIIGVALIAGLGFLFGAF